MRDYLDDKRAKKNQDEEKNKKVPRYDPDEEEETYMYDIKKPAEFINEGKNGVFDITKQTGERFVRGSPKPKTSTERLRIKRCRRSTSMKEIYTG